MEYLQRVPVRERLRVYPCLLASELERATTHANVERIVVSKMLKLLLRLWQDQSGQDLTEYALLLVLVALAALVAMKALANAINNVFSNAASISVRRPKRLVRR